MNLLGIPYLCRKGRERNFQVDFHRRKNKKNRPSVQLDRKEKAKEVVWEKEAENLRLGPRL